MSKKINRNDPCHCGSGKKYKQCCLKKEAVIARHTPEGKFKFSAEVAASNPFFTTLFQRSAEQRKLSQSTKNSNKFSLTKEKIATPSKKSLKRQKAKEEQEISEKLQQHQFSILNITSEENTSDTFVQTEQDYRTSISDPTGTSEEENASKEDKKE